MNLLDLSVVVWGPRRDVLEGPQLRWLAMSYLAPTSAASFLSSALAAGTLYVTHARGTNGSIDGCRNQEDKAMKDVRLSRRQVLKGAGAVGVLGALGIPITVFADDKRVRWDIISVDFATGTLSAGGMASALANDGSKITLTGSGTFGVGEDDGVTGGGHWTTFNETGSPTGSGKYKVTRLVSWVAAPGTPPLPHDNIGNRADESAGLAVLKIRYSDGRRGVLTVSCELVGSPHEMFEGVTVTKGPIDYWNREAPTPGVDANRTNFHVISSED